MSPRRQDEMVNGCGVGRTKGKAYAWLCFACGVGGVSQSSGDAVSHANGHRCEAAEAASK